MRTLILAAALALAACAAPAGPTTTSALVAADASTSLITGESLSAEYQSARASGEGEDPLVLLTLRHTDGRSMRFEEANHTATDLMAQGAGGALAQIMGLFGDESPVLYHARADENSGAPFICGSDGPVSIGMYRTADGNVQIVGLKQAIQFDTRPDGVMEALPFSPDQVCARLRFRLG